MMSAFINKISYIFYIVFVFVLFSIFNLDVLFSKKVTSNICLNITLDAFWRFSKERFLDNVGGFFSNGVQKEIPLNLEFQGNWETNYDKIGIEISYEYRKNFDDYVISFFGKIISSDLKVLVEPIRVETFKRAISDLLDIPRNTSFKLYYLGYGAEGIVFLVKYRDSKGVLIKRVIKLLHDDAHSIFYLTDLRQYLNDARNMLNNLKKAFKPNSKVGIVKILDKEETISSIKVDGRFRYYYLMVELTPYLQNIVSLWDLYMEKKVSIDHFIEILKSNLKEGYELFFDSNKGDIVVRIVDKLNPNNNFFIGIHNIVYDVKNGKLYIVDVD